MFYIARLALDSLLKGGGGGPASRMVVSVLPPSSSGSTSMPSSSSLSSSAPDSMDKIQKEIYIENFDYINCDDVGKYEKLSKIGQGTFGWVWLYFIVCQFCCISTTEN